MKESKSGETTNLYLSQPEVAKRLLQLLEADVYRGRSTDGLASKNDTDKIELWKSSGRKSPDKKRKK